MADERIRVTYRLTPGAGESPEHKARDIALEQTVELPEGCYPRAIADRIVGRVERLEPTNRRRWEAVISYDPEIVSGELLSLVNLLFGNTSMKAGVLVTDLALPDAVVARFRGPAFGIEGLRERCGTRDRPLVCAAVKPVGLSAAELAERCSRFAEAGIDLIKDDHSLANQPSAPFAERVRRCQEAVDHANARTGARTRYFPNLLGPPDALAAQCDMARAAGCAGVVLAPLLVGLDIVQWLTRERNMAVLAHPALSGALLGPRHGIRPAVLYGDIFRLSGADGVIYPNAGGRFPFSAKACRAINARLRGPLGEVRPAFPIAGGGVDAEKVPYWIERYGADTIFLIGSSFYRQPDLVGAVRRVMEAVELTALRTR